MAFFSVYALTGSNLLTHPKLIQVDRTGYVPFPCTKHLLLVPRAPRPPNWSSSRGRRVMTRDLHPSRSPQSNNIRWTDLKRRWSLAICILIGAAIALGCQACRRSWILPACHRVYTLACMFGASLLPKFCSLMLVSVAGSASSLQNDQTAYITYID